MKTVLFLGDSITDAGRNRDLGIDMPSTSMGGGYATIVSAKLGYMYPEKYRFYNKGVGGQGLASMYARLREDVIEFKPDYMSILAGVNDAWFDLGGKGLAPIDSKMGMDRFEKIYSLMIEEILAFLPQVKIMLLEPFTLDGKKTPYGDEGAWAETYEIFRKGVEEKASVSRKVAEKYNLPFVPLQHKFDEVYREENPRYWSWDGVHPTCMGHQVIAEEWLRGFETLTLT